MCLETNRYTFELNKLAKEKGLTLNQKVKEININDGIYIVITNINKVINGTNYNYEGLKKLRVVKVDDLKVEIDATETKKTDGWKHDFGNQLVKYGKLDEFCMKSPKGKRYFFNFQVNTNVKTKVKNKVKTNLEKYKEMYDGIETDESNEVK